MNYRYLGKSGLRISEVGLGTMTFSPTKEVFETYGGTDISESKKLVDFAIDRGVNFFDTADAYNDGAAEETLGKVLGKKRQDVIICTKVRFKRDKNGEALQRLSRHSIIESCNNSLKRLGTDYIDMYLLHAFDQLTPLEETLKVLDDLVRQGKIRYIGCSNFAAWEAMKALAVSDKHDLERFSTYQAYYSLASREVELEIIPLCKDQGLGITCWSPLSGGFFTGKYRRDKPIPASSRRTGPESITNIFMPVDIEKGYDTIEVLETVAQKHNATIPQVSLAYLLTKPIVSSVIVGSKKIEHLKDNIKASELKLDKEDIKMIHDISKPSYPYPHWFKKAIREKTGLWI